MADVMIDFYGHKIADTNGPALTAAAVGVPAVGQINPLAAAGSTSTVSQVAANDRRGSFLLNSSGTGQAAGVVCHVTFANPYPAPPAAITIDAANQTDVTASISVGVLNITAAGFDIVATALTAAKAYLVQYTVET